MRIAITGATGMLGATLTRQFIVEGHEVIAIVKPGSNRIGDIVKSDRVKVIECGMDEYGKLMDSEHCDIFYHLAWASTFGVERDNVQVQVNNIQYSINAARLAKSWGANTFVGVGSQAECGPVNVKINGQTPTNPLSGYGIAKNAACRLIKIFCDNNGIRFQWARILSVFGELDGSHTLISTLIESFVKGISPNLTKCEQIWDYVYSEDAAKALRLIGILGKSGMIYSIGSGEPRLLKDYVVSVQQIVSPETDINFGSIDYYPHQPMYLCADISDLTKDTGFTPEYSFEDGIRRIVEKLH